VQLFQYQRGKGQGEGRLHSKFSIGIGGHISADDQLGDAPVYEEGMRRELAEEVIIETPYTEQCVGLINDDQTEVGKVHLGVVHVFDVEQPAVRSRETDILEAGFRPIDEIRKNYDRLETWSQICFDAITRM
jgi:predicted NUDIX family phosphoesterase